MFKERFSSRNNFFSQKHIATPRNSQESNPWGLDSLVQYANKIMVSGTLCNHYVCTLHPHSQKCAILAAPLHWILNPKSILHVETTYHTHQKIERIFIIWLKVLHIAADFVKIPHQEININSLYRILAHDNQEHVDAFYFK